MNPDVKLAQVLQNGATNAQAARQAAPVQPPNMEHIARLRRRGGMVPLSKGVP